ncbi:MAG: carboxypeptidase M32 [Sandaracinaceae bacterium]|nr:carboxypeptidase M32 [Sandaracinaceae bacterium]
MNDNTSWDSLVDHVARIETLRGVMGTLGWDEQVMMPPKAQPLRGAQRALLSRLGHEWLIDERIGGWLADLEGSDDPVRRACHRNLGRTYRREQRIPAELVDQLARARSEGFAAWIDAKKHSDFARFAPNLERLLELSRRRAAAIDPDRHPYEVLLEEFDPGTSVASLREMFARLRDGLTPLLMAIADRPQLPELGATFDPDRQQALHREVAAALGYDFDGGRLDHAEHPFTTGLGAGDVRITTHITADDLLSGLGATIHEAGHALYEQGLPHEHAGTTVSYAASYGLHESQSRFWENFIGRSRPFCNWLAGRLEEHFPEAGVDAERLFRASNRVERGLIRVQADEVTYNLHVIVRFELELAMFEGTLAVKDLPEAWNARYAEYLGVRPESDARGVLQDVHWSGAAFGYFPSYTLGNLYASSLGATLERELPDLWTRVEAGDFAPILAFLRDRIHSRGHLDEAPEIIHAAVGDRDHVEDLVSYLWARHGALYGAERG